MAIRREAMRLTAGGHGQVQELLCWVAFLGDLFKYAVAVPSADLTMVEHDPSPGLRPPGFRRWHGNGRE